MFVCYSQDFVFKNLRFNVGTTVFFSTNVTREMRMKKIHDTKKEITAGP